MGNKGEKLSTTSTLSANDYMEKLKDIPGITSKKMFGGYGIFHNGKMFSIIDSKGTHFLKKNEINNTDFEKANSNQHSRMPYYSIPEKIFNDHTALLEWVKKAIET